MATFACPPRFIAMLRQLHDVMQARVQNDGEVANRVKQGCVMALFIMMFYVMFMNAFQSIDTHFNNYTFMNV